MLHVTVLQIYRLLVLIRNQPLRATQPATLCLMVNEYQPSGIVVMLYGSQGSRRSGVALTMRHGLCMVSVLDP